MTCMRWGLRLGTVSAFALALSGTAHAAGTALDVQSGRGTGMASAMTAHVDDSSSIYYNPAGIAQGRIIDAQVGGAPLVAGHHFVSPSGHQTNLKFAIATPFHAYVSGGVTENLSLGLGVFTPFGLSLAWPTSWEGRRLITEASNANYYFNPTAAYRFGPLRVGAGFQLVRSTVELKKAIAFGDQEGSVDLGGSAWGVGGNVGVQYEAIERYLSLGVHYRSAVKLSYDNGLAHFSNVPASLQATLHDQAVTTSLVLPDSLAVGLAGHPLEDLLLDVDLVWFNWNHLRSVNIHFPNDASGTLSSTEPKKWTNTVNVHLGAEGKLDEHWRLRGGILYDPTPSPQRTLAPDIPDASRVNLALGGTYAFTNGIHIDLGYQFLILITKASTNPLLAGDYGGNVNIVGLSVGYRSPR